MPGLITMIQLLFSLLIAEGALALLLVMNVSAFNEEIIRFLNQLKSGKGLAISRTLGGVVGVVFTLTITNILKIQKQMSVMGTVPLTDQVLMYKHILAASLMGFVFFLAIMIDRVHHNIRNLPGLLMEIETLKQKAKRPQQQYTFLETSNESLQARMLSLETQVKCYEKEISLFKERERQKSDELRVMKEEILELNQKLEHANLEMKKKDDLCKAAEANAIALTRQSEGFLLEYDRLLEENQLLRSQLSTFDRRFSHSDSKKQV